MLSRLAIFFALVVAMATCAVDARAEKRVALVVGNAAYVHTPALRNPRNDASDIAALLKKEGFDVSLGLDLDQQKFASLVDQFARQLDDADVALFYYAGHGLQINNKNYLVSVNARLTSEFFVSSETIELDAIIGLMESKVPINLVFLDACRDNPLADELKKNLLAMKRSVSLGRGLARIEPTRRDTLIAFAAAPGQEAADGNGRNSPFTSALLKYLPKPNLEVSVMLKLVAAEVGKLTHNTQRPQQLSDMTRTFYFSNAAADDISAHDGSTPLPPTRRAARRGDDYDIDVAFWNAAQSANDCDAIRAYLDRFPKGVFVTLAVLAERRLCQSQRHVTLLEAAPDTGNSPSTKSVPPPQSHSATPPQPVLSAPVASAPVANQQTALIKPPLMPAPKGSGSDRVFRDCGNCPEMINIPGGTFEMGSTEDSSESPVHRVAVGTFAIGRYPVTIGQWKQCVAARACRYAPVGDDDLPVYNIHWDDAQEYVRWLSQTTKARYRLPTEAEWEYAARGGATTKYWWGNALIPGKAACKGCGHSYSGERPIRIGLFAANGFGLFDMTGSIDQWVSDCWNRNYAGAPSDGSSWDRPNCRQHVLRGGSWKNGASYSRTSSRDSYDVDVRYPTHGLRVVRANQE